MIEIKIAFELFNSSLVIQFLFFNGNCELTNEFFLAENYRNSKISLDEKCEPLNLSNVKKLSFPIWRIEACHYKKFEFRMVSNQIFRTMKILQFDDESSSSLGFRMIENISNNGNSDLSNDWTFKFFSHRAFEYWKMRYDEKFDNLSAKNLKNLILKILAFLYEKIELLNDASRRFPLIYNTSFRIMKNINF